VVVEVKGWAPVWFAAKEMWSGGCQYLVATRRVNVGGEEGVDGGDGIKSSRDALFSR